MRAGLVAARRALCTSLLSFALVTAVPQQVLGEVRSSDRVDGRAYKDLGLVRAALPDVTMKAGALLAEDGRVLWSRRPNDRRAIASITKVMTAIVAIEHSDPDEMVSVGRASSSVGESTAFLRPGESLPMSEMLEALLVKSGNDAAVAIAAHVAGGEDKFVELMNDKAEELGLKRTHFENPHGLDEDGHYSTAMDVSVMVRYAMTKPEFRRVVGRKTAVIGSGRRSERIQSTNLLLGNYAGANGVKTGWTSDAGYCVVTTATRDGIELQAVVLGTSNELTRFRDARELLDFGFAHYRWQRLATRDTIIGESVVTDYLDVSVPAAVSEDTTITVFDVAGPISRSVAMAAVPAPVRVGDRIGVATFTQAGEVIATVPLVAAQDVERPTPLQRVGIAIVRLWRRFTGAG